MANGFGGAVLPQIRRILQGGTLAGLTDGQLLERFAHRNDDAAFEALLVRHGPLVLAVCRNLLRDRDDVEDAFQATLLVLVRKAGSIRLDEASLGPWIYSVAYRVAIRARANRGLRGQRESAVADLDPQAPAEDLEEHDVAPLLHQELAQLPERLRAPIVLCYLQGLTHELAAEQLRWPVGTVRSRMARARRLLRERLTRKGVTLSAGFLWGTAREATAKVIPRILSEETIRAAKRIAASRAATSGVLSGTVAALMEGVLSTMWLTKVKTTAATTILGGLIATGVVALAVQIPDDKPNDPVPTKRSSAPLPKPTANNSESTRSETYYVGDLVRPQPMSTADATRNSNAIDRPMSDFGPLIELLTSSVAPGSWKIKGTFPEAPFDETKSIGSITPFFLSLSLIVRHTDEVHTEIASRLSQIRKITAAQMANSPTQSAARKSDNALERTSGSHTVTPSADSPAPAAPVSRTHKVQKLIDELEKELDQLTHENAALRARANAPN